MLQSHYKCINIIVHEKIKATLFWPLNLNNISSKKTKKNSNKYQSILQAQHTISKNKIKNYFSTNFLNTLMSKHHIMHHSFIIQNYNNQIHENKSIFLLSHVPVIMLKYLTIFS